jgi:methylglutaconyl-CoA hydratase
MGLVQEVVAPEDMDGAVEEKLRLLSSSGPQAMVESKKLVRTVPTMDPEELKRYTAELIADLRASDEGQDGMRAFLEKKKPRWIKD